MPLPELFTADYPLPGRLSVMARPRGGEWLSDEVAALRVAGVDVLVSLLTAGEAAELELELEERWCREHGVQFHRLPIQDRGVPESTSQVQALVGALSTRSGRGSMSWSIVGRV